MTTEALALPGNRAAHSLRRGHSGTLAQRVRCHLSSVQGAVVTPDEIRAIAQTLPRSYEVFVRGQIKFRVGQIVWLALSKDGERMGCGFPKEMRQAAVEAEPHKFQLPGQSDMRFNWIHVRLEAIDSDEMRDLVEEAWSRAVPLYVAQEYGHTQGYDGKGLPRRQGSDLGHATVAGGRPAAMVLLRGRTVVYVVSRQTPARILAFWASNSASVRTPAVFSSPSCLSCSSGSGAGSAAIGAGSWYWACSSWDQRFACRRETRFETAVAVPDDHGYAGDSSEQWHLSTPFYAFADLE